jgi:hypothetical protein
MGATPVTTDKNIGTPITISNVQTKRRIISVTASVDETNGNRSIDIAYREFALDGSSVLVGLPTVKTLNVPTASLTAGEITEIDALITSSLTRI